MTSPVATRTSWKTKEGMVTVERVGSRVFVIEGYPEGIGVDRVMRAMGR